MRYAGQRVLLLLLLWLATPAAGQDLWPPVAEADREADHYAGRGLPFFYSHFAPQDYQAHPQNWSVVQDPRGVIYVANYDGILEYDGATWRYIRTTTNTIVRSLAVGANGTVYAGTQGDFGRLVPDSTGTVVYRSLVDQLAPEERNFADVWGTHVTDEAVYFQTSHQVFRWNGTAMRVWHSPAGFHTSFTVNGRFYVREKGVGLLEASGDSLRLAPEGGRFADRRIFAMMPLDDRRMLIATREEGLFRYDGRHVERFATEADAYLQQYRLYHGAALPGGYLALATLDGGGLVLLDRHGRLVQILTEAAGLPDGWINYVYADAQGGLWLALNNKGVMRLDVPASLTQFDHRRGLEGIIYNIARYQERLYVATSAGLYVEVGRTDGSRLAPAFEKVDGIPPAYYLLEYGGGLLVAADGGVFDVSRKNRGRVAQEKTFTLYASRKHPGEIYLGMKDGLAVLKQEGTQWAGHRLGGVGEEIYSMAEDEAGMLWITTRSRSIYRLNLADAERGASRVTRVDLKKPPAEGDIWALTVGGEVAFASERGLFRMNPHTASLYRDTTLSRATVQDTLLASTEDPAGNIWMVYADRVDRVRKVEGAYVHEAPAVLRFPKWRAPARAYVEGDGVVWLSSGSVLYRYEPDGPASRRYETDAPVLIRRISTLDTGKLIFGGTFASEAGAASMQQDEAAWPELSIQENALRFEFAAPSYNNPEESVYQYFLEGHDEGWSDWTHEASKQYANLWEGTYRFRVRARNAQGHLLPEGHFSFRVLPPWYRTWWAYSFYLVGLLGLGVFYRRYRRMVTENKRAQAQAEELARERVLNERLHQVNQRLHEVNETLKQADRLKDELLANTSHELRTPLTAILGFTAILKEEVGGTEHAEFIEFIEENGQRLLHTLEAMLELASLRAGTMEVSCERVDVNRSVARVSRLVTAQAAKKGLTMTTEAPEEPVYAWMDAKCFECILNNLVGNAVKFTEQGGVTIQVVPEDDRVVVHVRDTGIGIEPDFLPHLFDEFRQESSGLTRSHEGSGLGLAVTAQLVNLMHGEIRVASEKGEGSTFTVIFPAHAPSSDPIAASLHGEGMTIPLPLSR